ncbi:uncharacterized protein PHALS_05218 [Plasmopara halstedii]|uniref:Uncharacterized protein n=1 Tax=Plasmopara halstedii TaxID=4781 RepID=A0A0P1B2Q4_PLAHL|nr:uncharacterized protein PHALS_05218 [Plasmopara halstedii]CEG47893.1 hypothetical protein PHALS_05218 [Plasmopara halstedii]|eukprot:XP_024584262.1 hypothetical protein PHALS_05218 [Plasmopara halstedii]
MIEPVERKPCKAMNPDRLRKLIDSPSILNDTRKVSMAIVKSQTLTKSWNGEQSDIRPFEKLAIPAQVIRTKDLRSSAISVGKSVAPSGLQLNDVAIIPKNDELQNEFTTFLMTQKETVTCAAEIEQCAIPKSVLLKEGIMNPQQRRERLRFETDHLLAKRAIHRTEMNDRRLQQIIKGRHSTCDVLGTHHDASRSEGDEFKSNSIRLNKSQISRREYQRKNSMANSHLNHHDRFFNDTPLERNQQRAQNLRNQSAGGRPYDIINGGHVMHFPPTIAEKQHQWQAHPSVNIHRYTQ